MKNTVNFQKLLNEDVSELNHYDNNCGFLSIAEIKKNNALWNNEYYIIEQRKIRKAVQLAKKFAKLAKKYNIKIDSNTKVTFYLCFDQTAYITNGNHTVYISIDSDNPKEITVEEI